MRVVTEMKKLSMLLILCVLVLPLFGQEESDWYLNKTIKGIRFDGLLIVTQKEVDPIVKTYKGKAFTNDLWMELLAKVYELDLFDEIAPEAIPSDASSSGLIIVFKVREKASVASISISGNSGIRSQEILDAMSIKEKTIFNPSRLRLDEISIRQLYQEKGYPEASVSAEQTQLAGKSVSIKIIINEGSKSIVESIRFEGVQSFSEAALKGAIKLKEKGFLQAGKFSEALLEESRLAIEAYYQNRGYIDAKISTIRRESAINPKDGNTMLTLTFVLEEGSRYLYDGMSFEGNTLFSKEELDKLLRTKIGTIISKERIIKDQERITDLYFENGYIFNGFNLREVRNEETATIAYVMQIEERPQAYIEDIIFRGQVKTKDYVLERLMEIEPGDVFSKGKLMSSLRALYNTQFFSAIAPEYEQGSKDLYVDLIINVEEQSTASIQFGVTYTPIADPGAFPVIGLINWSDINFLGNGQNIALKTNLAINSQDLVFTFGDDWLFGKHLSGAVDLSFEHKALTTSQDTLGPLFEYGSAGSNLAVPDPYNSLAEYEAAGKVLLDEYKMPYDSWTLGISYYSGWRNSVAIGTLGLGAGIRHDLELITYDSAKYRPYEGIVASNLDKWKFSNTLFLRAYLNNLDLWYDPSNGFYLSQRLGLTGWFNDESSKFLRSDTRLDGFVTLFDIPVGQSWAFKWVLGAHSKYSSLFAQPWRDEISATQASKLVIDGTFVGRGWSSLMSQPGTALWDNWLELRMPLVPNVLALDGFFSAAMVGENNKILNIDKFVNKETQFDDSLSLESFAYSVGYGLRFLILQFPFRLYMAKQFTFGKDQGFRSTQNPWQFVLSVTTSLD